MTPKEKAEELIEEFYKIEDSKLDEDAWIDSYLAKRCAMVAVDEIIREVDWHDFETPNKVLNYWQEVKQEIEKL
jgi:hypothetical protein